MADATQPDPATAPADDDLVFYFPHELAGASVQFVLDPPDGDGAADAPEAEVRKRGATGGASWASAEIEPDGTTGSASLAFLGDKLAAGEVTFADSPFCLQGPPPPEQPPPPPPPPPHQQLSAKGKLGINFGKDKLTITGALNGGGGAAATGGGGGGWVVGGSGGQGGTVTLAAKAYTINPVFEVGALLKSDESIILALRAMLRFFFHWCDALDLCIDYVKNKLPATTDPGSFLVEALGFNWWYFVFSLFAMKDMLYDMMSEEADFILQILEKIGVEAKLDATVSGSFDLEVGADISGSVSGRVYLPLAVMLAPVIEFLMAGSTAPAPKEGSLADRIVPLVEGVLEERFSVAVGGMPAAIMVEAKGVLAKCTFSVPKGSPLRKKIEEVGRKMGEAAQHYKDSKAKTLQKGRETLLLRLVLDLLDHEVRNIVKLVRAGQALKSGDAAGAKGGADALEQGLNEAAPYVREIFDTLRGKPRPPEPQGPSAEAKKVADALARTKAAGVQGGQVSPLEVVDQGEAHQVILHAPEEEKRALEQAGVTFKDGTAEELESWTFLVALPGARPAEVRWNFIDSNAELSSDYAGLVAGFDQQADRDACLDACVQKGWVAAELGRYARHLPDDSQGRHWAWVATGLSQKLAAAEPPVPLPEAGLSSDGKLKLVFDALVKGALSDAVVASIPLLAGATKQKATSWKLVLLDQASVEDADELRAQVAANQPDDDPYKTIFE